MNSLIPFWRRVAPQQPLAVDLRKGGHPIDLPGETVHAPRLEAALQQRRRIDLLLLDAAAPGVPDDYLFGNRIQAVLFPGDAAEIANLLTYHQFALFTEDASGKAHVTDAGALAGRTVLALHQRFVAPPQPVEKAGVAGRGIDLPYLFKRFSVEARGVIHVGALAAGELDLYQAMGFRRVIVIEGHPERHQEASALARGRANVAVLPCVASDRNGMETLYAHGAGASLLRPAASDGRSFTVNARRLDFFLREIGQNPADFNFLRLDAHGSELRILRGAWGFLGNIQIISTALTFGDSAAAGATDDPPEPEDLDDYLATARFGRLVTSTPREHPAWGDALYLRDPACSFRNLGQWGRFGNQVFEYAFIKIFGKRHRLRVETSPWPGNTLFGANDPQPSRQYPQHLEQTYALADSLIARTNVRPINIDVCGVYQYHTAYYAPHKAFVKELWSPVPALKAMLDAALAKARGNARTLVALHLRRGDYGYGMFFIPPVSWYLDWLCPLWKTLEAPALYIATDEPAKVLPDFADFKPIAAADLRLPSFGADYYPDFYVLGQADHVAISNSSFSFSACMMNERSKTFLRPDLFAGKLMPFEPWNDEPLLHRELGILDFKQVARALPLYLARPSDPQLHNAMRNWRAQLSESWSKIRGDQLDIVLSRDLWICYNDLRKANLRPHPLVEVEKQILQRIMDRLAKGQASAPRDAIGPFIGATLFVEAATLPAVDLSSLPRDIQEVLRS